jgi:hypothetical protein
VAGLLSDRLATYLIAVSRRPFVWGTDDCAMFVADWVRAETGRDGASALRGRYAGPDGARAMHGPLGLARTVDRCARSVGMVRTRYPNAGDIGVVAIGRDAHCAIATGHGWVVRGDKMIMRVPMARVIAAWTLGD